MPEKAGRSFSRRLRHSAKGMTGLCLILLFALIALAAPLLAPYDPAQQMLEWRFQVPSLAHPLGGDNLGRDILSRVILGTRTSLAIAVLVVAVSSTVGSVIGAIAGYAGGLLDTLIMRIVDFYLAFPFLLLALLVMAVLGPGFWSLILALVLALWVKFARVVRGEALGLRQLEFIEAARSIGLPAWRIVARHVLPNVLPAIIVLATLDVALVILAEAALSFLGLGVQPPTPSWGGMISEGRDFLADAPSMTLGPGLAMMLVAIGINLLGDFLRDAYDPRLEHR